MAEPSNPTRSRVAEAPVPPYTACARCDEYAQKTLHSWRGQILCENCRELARMARRSSTGASRRPQRHPIRPCAICCRVAPSELHHVASERQHPILTLPVCLNCHRLLSQRQYRWHPAWKRETHSWRYLAQGVYDVLCLWWERSPVAEMVRERCGDLLRMLGLAALYALAALRPEALGELRFLVHWSAL